MIIRLDRMLAHRKMTSKELAKEIGMTEVMLSRIRTGKIKGIKFDVLEKICVALDCDICDILELEKRA